MLSRRHLLTTLATAFATLTIAAAPALAQSYPTRPIKLIAPFPAGGSVDIMARLVAQRLSATLGQVIVENRPGAGSTLAGKIVATSDPDGYTIMLASSSTLAIGPALYSSAGYDPLTAFAPIAMISSVPYLLVVAKNTPWKSVAELVAYAKANPGKLNLATANGAPQHMLSLMFRQQSGADIVVVPYRGSTNVIIDMIAGQIEAGFDTTAVTLAHVRSGALRALAAVREERMPDLPDVPTLKESGLPGVIGSSWTAVVAPAGTPPDIVAKLRAAILDGLKTSELKDRFAQMSAEPRFDSPEELKAFIASEHQRIGAIIKAAGVKGE
jgi:tripartite-type tricarboxylate transporter receptor subunit TctC